MSLTVLFVDDDNNLISGLSRLLTLEKRDIDFDTASSGEDALKLLERRTYDVIVTDHKMPGMTGLTLLSITRSKYPEMKRVILSAQVNEKIFKEAGALAHKYISKPCDFEIIIAEIEDLVHQ
jgi:DNA-binding NtrC family response regulator